MIQNLLTQLDINSLQQNTDISIEVDINSQQLGFILENLTPYYFGFYDDNGILLQYIEPWTRVQDTFSVDERYRKINSMVTTRPQIQSNTAPSSTWAFTLDFKSTTLPPKVDNLVISNAANVTLQGNNTVEISGTVATNITNASIPVTGNVNATIENASIAVTGTVSIGNTPSVTLTGTNTVNIGNTPAVTVTSGTIAISGTPSVSISGTPTVAISASNNTVNIGNTPSVNINSGSVNATIQNASINTNTIVNNPQTQPVPTIPQTYYGTGSDGAFNPSSNTNFNNTPNQADIRNFTSVNIPAGITVGWANPAHYTVWFVKGDVTISGILNAAVATNNIVSTQPQIKILNGTITVPLGGMGGNGGAGGTSGYGVAAKSGGTAGSASPYGGGGGGGGASGAASSNQNGNSGTNGNNGDSTVTGGLGGTNSNAPNASGQAGINTNPNGQGTSTLIIIASGNITIGGTIVAKGIDGGAGGAGGAIQENGTTGNWYQSGNGGGGAGGGSGGNGGNGLSNWSTGASTSPYAGGGGGGGGGEGGGVVLLYSGGGISITGTVNVNGGNGGVGGAGGDASAYSSSYSGHVGNTGSNGQAGTVLVYQYNNQVSG